MNTYPVELEAPDIQPYRAGNCGVEYVSSFDSGKPGPHLMLAALTHGNELCGAIALDWLLRAQVRPLAGRLTLAFMNVAAFARFDRSDPRASRCVDEDFNRVWSKEAWKARATAWNCAGRASCDRSSTASMRCSTSIRCSTSRRR
jgi:predicted deacylase